MLLVGDCVEQMKTLEENSVDAIISDPPYGLEFMGKAWDGFGTPLGFQTWTEQWAREALRVLKPGGHLLAFGGTRMYHRLAAGVEDAGFEIRDTLMWLYGSGFPKSLDVSKAIDKAAGAEREVFGSYEGATNIGKVEDGKRGYSPGTDYPPVDRTVSITAPATEAAKQWEGWGTALKPAVEPIVLARKPLIGTVADNVLKHGTGALNIDASRIGTDTITSVRNAGGQKYGNLFEGKNHIKTGIYEQHIGRWPANILLDEAAAAMLDEQSGESVSQKKKINQNPSSSIFLHNAWQSGTSHGDFGGASRFFYVAKASRAERNKGLDGFEEKASFDQSNGSFGANVGSLSKKRANIHPTVKPVDLMRYLIRLVTPKGGTVLDPFLGSGTTAVAAIEEGVNWIGCEREPEYVAIIEARIAAAQPGMGLNLEEDTK